LLSFTSKERRAVLEKRAKKHKKVVSMKKKKASVSEKTPCKDKS